MRPILRKKSFVSKNHHSLLSLIPTVSNILCAFIFHESDDWLAPYKKKQRSPTCFSSGMWPFSKKPYYVATNSFITISFKYIVLQLLCSYFWNFGHNKLLKTLIKSYFWVLEISDLLTVSVKPLNQKRQEKWFDDSFFIIITQLW